MFDYVIFCLRTCWARTLFLIFPQKLQRLKQERKELAAELKLIINKYVDYEGCTSINTNKIDNNDDNIKEKDNEYNINNKIKEDDNLISTSDMNKNYFRDYHHCNTEIIKDTSKDDIEYLERRYSLRITKPEILDEMMIIENSLN